jgi:hypothetical protein
MYCHHQTDDYWREPRHFQFVQDFHSEVVKAMASLTSIDGLAQITLIAISVLYGCMCSERSIRIYSCFFYSNSSRIVSILMRNTIELISL